MITPLLRGVNSCEGVYYGPKAQNSLFNNLSSSLFVVNAAFPLLPTALLTGLQDVPNVSFSAWIPSVSEIPVGLELSRRCGAVISNRVECA